MVDPKTGDIVDSVSKLSSFSDDTSSSYNFDVVNHVIQTKKPFQFLDALDEYNDGISETLKLSKIRSVLCLPLSDKSIIVGVMYIDSIEKAHIFKKEDLYLMKFLSDTVTGLWKLLHLSQWKSSAQNQAAALKLSRRFSSLKTAATA